MSNKLPPIRNTICLSVPVANVALHGVDAAAQNAVNDAFKAYGLPDGAAVEVEVEPRKYDWFVRASWEPVAPYNYQVEGLKKTVESLAAENTMLKTDKILLRQAIKTVRQLTELAERTFGKSADFSLAKSACDDALAECGDSQSSTAPNASEIELKPCPFCGYQDIRFGAFGLLTMVNCPGCGASTRAFKGEHDAAAKWNGRAVSGGDAT